MKYKKYTIMPMILALLSVTTSCEQEDLPPAMPDGDMVEVTADIGSTATRVSQPEDNEYTFDANDRIHIVGWYGTEGWDSDLSDFKADPDVPLGLYDWWNDAVSTYDAVSGRWKTEPYMRWQNGENLKHHFIAWWPEDFVGSTDNFTRIPVQITGNAKKDDILWAHWTDTRPNDNTLRLQFNHLMARFDVHLKFRDQYMGVINEISIETNLRNQAKCDLLTGNVTEASGNDIVMAESEHPDSRYDWSGTCITVPHEFSGEELLILKFTVNGEPKAITYRHPTSLTFQSGHRTTLTLQVGKEKVDVEGVYVTDWNVTPTIDAGEAEEDI